MYYSKYKFDLILLRGVDFIFSVALTVTAVLGGFDGFVTALLNGESSSFVVYRFYKWFTLHFTFFTCIIDWVCSIRTARSGGIYGACLSYLIALKLICIKSLTREQIYTYYIVLLGFLVLFSLFVPICTISLWLHTVGVFKIYPNIL